MHKCLFIIFLFPLSISAQELFVYSEPASNMPTRSISIKLTSDIAGYDKVFDRAAVRFRPELMFGFHRKFMLHLGGSLSNMHTADFKGESAFIYMKYRFLSFDEVHKHFRMAMFTDASLTKAPFHSDEISLAGDKTGIAFGVIATQLWNKLAVSATVSHTQLLDSSRFNDIVYLPQRNYQSMNYSLSAGYLVFPLEYTSYKQLNLNFYTELLAQQTLDHRKYYVDLAPAVQFIINSNMKLNIGYRTELAGNMDRGSRRSWLISFEKIFLDAFGKKRSK